jgi:hypothetical protein
LKSTGLAIVSGLWETVGMPKKQKQPQTHEEHEVQTLVDRIEKKASALSKRNLRIVKRVKNVPVLGVCEYCNAQFPADPHRLGQLGDAQSAIQEQFNAHKCKPEDDSPAAARIVKEATEDK